MRESDVLGGTSVTISAQIFREAVPKSEVKNYIKRVALMFDLRLSDLILVFKPDLPIDEAFDVVRVLR